MLKSMNICSLNKGQDFGLMGSGILESTQETFEWIVGMDTNGTNDLLLWFKEQNWDEIMNKKNSLEYLLTLISSCDNTFEHSGSTYMEVKVFKDRIETINVGDSTIMILNNDKIIYKSKPHNLLNRTEVDRLKCLNIDIKMKKTTNIPTILSSTKITNGTGMNYYFKNNDSYIITKSTQLLGHNNITEISPEYYIYYLIPNVSVQLRVILATDGFTDMINFTGESCRQDLDKLIHLSCDELSELAVSRWKQNWEYYYDDNKPYVFIIHNLTLQKTPCSDDIFIGIIDIP